MKNNGSLTEAQKLLLQKFPQLPEDDPLVELAAWNAALEQKVDNFGESLNIWTQAILKQTDLATQQNQLIVSQNLSLQETAKNNAALGQTLLKLNQDFKQLKTDFQSLTDTINNQFAALQSLSEVIGIKHTTPQVTTLKSQTDSLGLKMIALEGRLRELTKTLTNQNDAINTINNKFDTIIEELSASRRGRRTIFFILIGFGIVQSFLLYGFKDLLDLANKNLNSALIRLERLERR